MFRSFFGPSLQWRNRLPPTCEGMPQEDVTELSDEGREIQGPVVVSAKSKAKAKAKSSVAPKHKAAGKTKIEKPVKNQKKKGAGKQDAKPHAHEEDAEEEPEVPEEPQPEGRGEKKLKKEKPVKKDAAFKRPSAKVVAKKPAANTTPHVPKVYKYKYHKDGKWGLKLDGREQFTVRALCQFKSLRWYCIQRCPMLSCCPMSRQDQTCGAFDRFRP